MGKRHLKDVLVGIRKRLIEVLSISGPIKSILEWIADFGIRISWFQP